MTAPGRPPPLAHEIRRAPSGASEARQWEMRIVLIRHASTETDGRLCGAFDVSLSTVGLDELAAVLGKTRTRRAPDVLLTSTLRRAHDVARALGRAWGLRPQLADWAREIHCGTVEGMRLDHVQREWPDHWRRNEAQADEGFAWPGGETYAQFRARILNGLNVAATAHSVKRIALVTHAGVIAQVLGVIRGRPASVWTLDRPDPLTATEVTWNCSTPGEVVTFNSRDWF
jgi:broad specificity phosphatase PhoE